MRISGCGCSLADYLYNGVDFSSAAVRRYLSRAKADGGMVPGKLVFVEELERFAGKDFDSILRDIVDERPPDTFNVGGPSIVALTLASQLLFDRGVEVAFYGAVGDDWIGRRILEMLGRTAVNTANYKVVAGASPFTTVFSDPNYDAGHGERMFVNNIGTAGHYGPEDLPESFFRSDVLLFGATAITPPLHDALSALVRRGRSAGAITIVSTVYDFRSEKANPGGRWALGDSEAIYKDIDLFVADREEALSISGAASLDEACAYYISQGVSAFAITHGPNPVRYYSDGRLFAHHDLAELPVAQAIGERLARDKSIVGDTTGCGDNFVGGMIASLVAQQTRRRRGELDMGRAVAVGICAGGCACFHLGGFYQEKQKGEKARIVAGVYAQYRKQLKPIRGLPAAMLD